MPGMLTASLPKKARVSDSARKESWADVEDDWESPTPLYDDSYSEAPMPGLENSKDGLNKRLKAAADLSDRGPKDFAFLTKKAHVGKDVVWQFNATAPEFIPTLTFTCPLVGICHVLPKDQKSEKAETDDAEACTTAGNTPATIFSTISPSLGARSRGNSLEDWDLDGGPRTMSSPIFEAASFAADGMLAKPRSFSIVSSSSPVFAALPSPQLKKRCKPSTIQVPPRKRIKSEERRELLVPGLKPEAHPAEQEKEEEQQQHCDGVVPEASEEDWHRREEARQKCVQIGKDTDEYRKYIDRRPNKEDRDASEPMTPDPRDRTVSKRRWGQAMNEWRQALKA